MLSAQVAELLDDYFLPEFDLPVLFSPLQPLHLDNDRPEPFMPLDGWLEAHPLELSMTDLAPSLELPDQQELTLPGLLIPELIMPQPDLLDLFMVVPFQQVCSYFPEKTLLQGSDSSTQIGGNHAQSTQESSEQHSHGHNMCSLLSLNLTARHPIGLCCMFKGYLIGTLS